MHSFEGKRCKKALGLTNALKFDELTYLSDLRIKSMWIDVFFNSILKKQNVMTVDGYLNKMKENLI